MKYKKIIIGIVIFILLLSIVSAVSSKKLLEYLQKENPKSTIELFDKEQIKYENDKFISYKVGIDGKNYTSILKKDKLESFDKEN